MADPATSTDTRPVDPDELRGAMLDQLQYLIDEVEALKGVVDRVPPSVREGRPTPDALSMKEIYAVIAQCDVQVHRPRIERIAASEEDGPRFEPVEDDTLAAGEDWNARPIHDILDRVQSARRSLVALLDGLPASVWSRVGKVGDEEQSVYEVVHGITQDDARRLRTLGHRLHAANLTKRERDLPK